MSLINNVLNDLDSRANQISSAQASIVSGLQPAQIKQKSLKRLSLLLFFCLLGVPAYFVYESYFLTTEKRPDDAIAWKQSINRQEAKPIVAEPVPLTKPPAKKTTPPPPVDTPTVSTKPPVKTLPPPSLVIKPRPEQIKNTRWSQIEKWYRARKWEKALAALQGFIKDYPADLSAMALSVEMLTQQGHTTEALASISRWNSTLNHAQLWKWQGQLLLEVGQTQEAIKLLQALALQHEVDAETQALLGTAFQQLSQHEAALGWYNKALAQQKHQGQWWLSAGISNEALQRFVDARKAYQQALRDVQLQNELRHFASKRLAALPPPL